jgi:hypothetical protein
MGKNAMAGEQMAADVPGRRTTPAYGWALLETAIVFLVLAAPLASEAFIDLIVLGPLGLVVVYVIWAPVAAYRRAGYDLPSIPRAALFSLGQLVSALLAVGGLSALVVGVWMNTAYREEVLNPGGMGIGFPFNLSFLANVALGMTVASAAMFIASTVFLRRRDESARDFPGRILSERMRPLLPAAATTLLLGFGISSILNVISAVVSLPSVLQSANPSRDVDGWFLVTEFAGLPAAQLASAVLLVAFRRTQPAALACLRDPHRLADGHAPAVLAALASIGMFYGWFLYLLHFGMIAAFGPVAMIMGWQEVSGAAEGWVAAQREAGRSPVEIAAELRTYGSWTIAEPDSGLAEIFPGLGETLKESSLSEGCSVALDAGVADNVALQDQDWIQDFEAESQPLPDVGYCIRLACPSPVVWHERPVVILASSHPSRNSYWADSVFLDLFGNGRAFEPGGYCTVDGELAAAYQG